MKLTDKDLPNSATGREAKHVGPDGRVAAQKGEGRGQLARGAGGLGDPEPLAGARAHEGRAEHEVAGRQQGREQVVGAHHLRARVAAEGLEDVVLRAVGQAVEEEVDAEEEEAPRGLAGGRAAGLGMAFLARVQGEDGDAGGHGGDDEVLVERVALAEDGDVQEHDGQQLARLGEDEGDVVDVGERGVAEGGSEGRGEGHQEQRRDDGARGEDRGAADARGRAEEEVEVARQEGKGRLDG